MEILLGGLAVFYYLFFGLICALYWRPHENMFMAAFFVVLWPLILWVVAVLRFWDIVFLNKSSEKDN
ncbi:MAG: hypothetical protein A3A97_03510 [Candidatus Terrybacteria bacterium RIFCSPLOWO2_01_FULL_40_23]|uniref:Uncharacterized protein n=1 Tax=Candidatus Terrybacteria bacterium RIFCSPLOWO2_01_FULL_40_23 TaxID=1802366 RepID=A0A1G2PS02_9BACT|nr:MAG: hypothetical protein A3A97_03510 [Candidatus Terrybacteria bacterium RIFCSPLOWO2_01_FULL_40_23]